MSKSLGNVVDPLEIIRDFGTDALRFTVATGMGILVCVLERGGGGGGLVHHAMPALLLPPCTISAEVMLSTVAAVCLHANKSYTPHF